MKKRILCFGDSNTWGYTVTGGRFGEDVRWPMRLQTLLGDGYAVIEEGFNGRTCVYDDPIEGGFKSGLQYLPPCVMTQMIGNCLSVSMSLKRIAVARAARSIGKITYSTNCQRFAPSICADSTGSTGIERRPASTISITNGAPIQTSTIIIDSIAVFGCASHRLRSKPSDVRM